MVTRNTLEDITFAEMHLEYVARRSPNPLARAEAQTISGIIRLLDYHQPEWRSALLAELASRGLRRELDELLTSEMDFEPLLKDYLSSLVNHSKQKGSP